MATAFHLRDGYAPVGDELDVGPLPVTGRVPADLNGTYLRNGPNPLDATSASWFSGEGMVHAVDLAAGEALGYRNRWVRTPWHHDPTLRKLDASGRPRLDLSLANTNVVRFAGRVLALEENSLPYELAGDLSTVGPWDMGGTLRTAMTAHPKRCPTTGELHLVGYAPTAPHLTYHLAGPEGVVRRSVPIDLPAPVMVHDVGLTASHVVLLDLPVAMTRHARRQPSFAWDDAGEARIGLLRRDDPSAAPRWFRVAPCYVFHLVEVTDADDGSVVVDAVRYPELWRAGAARPVPPAVLWRWRLDPASGAVVEEQRDDRSIEFPRVDERRAGLGARYAHVVETRGRSHGTIVRYDLVDASATVWDPGPGRVPGEPVVVPRGGAPTGAEDDAWVLALVYDAASDRSDLVVLAADDVAAGPVAAVHLPRRVPFGFHGTWLDAGGAA